MYPPIAPPATIDVTDLTVQRGQHAADHNSIADWLAVLIPGPWYYVNVAGAAPLFTSPWTNYSGGSGGWQPLRFRREGGDICRVEGLVANGNSGTYVFTLPIGFRPAQNLRFAQGVSATTSAGNAGWTDVYSSGQVMMTYFAGSGVVAAGAINCTFAIDPSQL